MISTRSMPRDVDAAHEHVEPHRRALRSGRPCSTRPILQSYRTTGSSGPTSTRDHPEAKLPQGEPLVKVRFLEQRRAGPAATCLTRARRTRRMRSIQCPHVLADRRSPRCAPEPMARPGRTHLRGSRPLLAPGAILRRAALAGEPVRPAEVLRLQRALGNRAVGELLHPPSAHPFVQTKLTVNAPGDRYEREADRTAEQVMRMPAMEEGVQRASGSEPRSSGGGGGQALTPDVRATFEAKFAADFARVRIHTGAQAALLSHALGTHAFAKGTDVFFGSGEYAPDTTAGQRLLAHELSHVVQQGGAPLEPQRAERVRDAAPEVTPITQASPGVRGEHIQRKLDWNDTDWKSAQRAGRAEGAARRLVRQRFRGEPDSRRGAEI